MNNNIEISEKLISAMEEKGRMVGWAKNVVASSKDRNLVLSQEDMDISEEVNKYIKKMDKVGSTNAREQIASLINVIVEDEVYNAPSEILDQIFSTASYGEFDKVQVTKSIKNTLIAYESQARTGNVPKSYLDFSKGNVSEKHLQIETEIKMSDLRRQGAVGVAQYALFAVEQFENKKFAIVMDLIDGLVAGGENYFKSVGGLTVSALNDFTGYLYENISEGVPEAVGLASMIHKIYSLTGIENKMSDIMKDELNDMSLLKRYNGTALVPIKDGKKMGDGSKLLPKNKLYGIAGIIGSMYTKGDLRVLSSEDINAEKIHLKFTGVEFGVCITDVEKIAKLEITDN